MKLLPVLLIAGSVLASISANAAAAEESSWEARVRAVYLDPANKSDAIPALAVPSDAVHINSKMLPEFDFEYFLTPAWSSELILTYAQSQRVTVERSA
ncbi:MAG TPA: hypothetical protein VKP66_04615, partial [Steroidobacteraceae bacterium]|nr:hypothetical protein [Steroidobacteraceae bacterium]